MDAPRSPLVLSVLLPAVRIVRTACRAIVRRIAEMNDEADTGTLIHLDVDICDALLEIHAFPDCAVPAVPLADDAEIGTIVSSELGVAWQRVAQLQPCDCAHAIVSGIRPSLCLQCKDDASAPLPLHWQRYHDAWYDQLHHYSISEGNPKIPLRAFLERYNLAARVHARQRRTVIADEHSLVHVQTLVDLPDARTAGCDDAGCDGDDAAAAAEQCVICMDLRPNVVFLNCRHMCVCAGCVVNFKDGRCPCCRQKIFKALRVYV